MIEAVRSRSVFILIVLLLFSVPIAQSRELPDFTRLVEENSPAVVNISTTQKIKRRAPSFNMPDLPEDSPFNEFFRRFFGDEGAEPKEFDSKSLGSGFVISKDGYILTNNHVVRDADEIIVRLSDRREFVAKIVGTDERSDVALLKIEDDNSLPTVRIGESGSLKVGEWVLAIGSPFGFDHSVTAGIVSAKGRSLPSENYVPFIQTDVAINPGNSGGPLFNLDGEVVGINAQIFSRTGGFMGLSFAIPIDVAIDVAEQLKTTGHVTRGWLGVLIQDVTRELAESFSMDQPRGALVSRVLPDSPADKAGFEVGDVIINFNNGKIHTSSELPPVVGRTKVGKKVPVIVIRDGERKKLHVRIGKLPDEDQLQLASGKSPSVTSSRLAISVADLSAEQRRELDLDQHGVLVTKVQSGPGQKAGLRSGDVILRMNNIEIRDAKHFKKIVSDLPEDRSVPLLVQRRGGPIFLALRIE